MLRICQIRIGCDAMIAHSNNLGKGKSPSSQAEDNLGTPIGRIAPENEPARAGGEDARGQRNFDEVMCGSA
jgi:hypothetical protein